ncbi:hypothetical protein MF406_15065 [Georgenia sp. TF02-10]|uniref:hypothetical protein n=1 Tax=Georgenia sp. TF02-10 TaxID=2917725 RepID=UPI001FA6CB52|nr:hypothetical protein [Georgenia sp. TF02-10]UNX54232.1 hypothetical protein MF406_15065 [Georgenia sp. TF02-10]
MMHDTFSATTVDELRRTTSLRRLAAIIDQRLLFPRSGDIELADGTLQLGTWRSFNPGDILSVSLEFLPEYGRVAAGGARGGFPSFGAFKRLGAPLVLDLRSGERILLLIGYIWLAGTTKNAAWLPELRAFAMQHGGDRH